MNDYLKQSGYLGAAHLEKIFPRQITAVMTTVCLVAVLACAVIAVILGSKSLFTVALLLLVLFYFLAAYFLFTNFLQEDRSLSANEIAEARAAKKLGMILNFSAVQVLETSVQGNTLKLYDFFNHTFKLPEFVWILRRLNILPQDFQKRVLMSCDTNSTMLMTDVLETAWQIALSANHLNISEYEILAAVYELDKNFQKVLFSFEAEQKDFFEVIYWRRRKDLETKIRRLDIKGIGKDWSGGYTVQLDETATDITAALETRRVPSHLYGQSANLELLQRMLVRGAGSSNVVLVGPPGVGKHHLIDALAELINSGQTFPSLRYMRLLQIDSSSLIAGTLSPNQILSKIGALFMEAYAAGNVILVVNDIDALLDSGRDAVGRVNATEALLRFFQSSLHIIGLTTPSGYQNTIGRNPMLQKLIAKLELDEPTNAETLMILQDHAVQLERDSGLFFTHQALQQIVLLAGKLIQNLPNPEKSLEVLSETAVYVAVDISSRIVLPEHVQHVVAEKTKVPVEKISMGEKYKLLNLEEILHRRIIGQDEAVRELADSLRRARSGIRSEKKPIGSFLFLGPTGVGKTETTKALAETYFGDYSKILRFDMSEFQEIHALNRLIGDADTGTGGLLTEQVVANPFSLVLLDELEKAHPKILDLFLQVLDDGILTDFLGRKISFINTMIIATSNAGSEMIRNIVKEGNDPQAFREQILGSLQSQNIFRPEFLNRFDGVVIFKPLSPEDLLRVAGLLLAELNSRLAEKEIQVEITDELCQTVVSGGYQPEFGARPLRRYIQEHLENFVARGLIDGSIKKGDTIRIDPGQLS